MAEERSELKVLPRKLIIAIERSNRDRHVQALSRTKNLGREPQLCGKTIGNRLILAASLVLVLAVTLFLAREHHSSRMDSQKAQQLVAQT